MCMYVNFDVLKKILEFRKSYLSRSLVYAAGAAADKRGIELKTKL